MDLSTLRNTDLSLGPPPTPPPQPSGDPGKLRSIWLITGKKREREWAEGRGGRRGEAASSVSSEIGGARVTKALFLCQDRE